MFYKLNSFWCQRLSHEVYPLCQTFVDEFNIADFQQFEDLFISICVIPIILEFSKPKKKKYFEKDTKINSWKTYVKNLEIKVLQDLLKSKINLIINFYKLQIIRKIISDLKS